MMDINSIEGIAAAKATEATKAVSAPKTPKLTGEVQDVVEMSTARALTERISQVPDVRADLVERVREEIAAGSYETQERLDIAVERLMEDLLADG